MALLRLIKFLGVRHVIPIQTTWWILAITFLSIVQVHSTRNPNRLEVTTKNYTDPEAVENSAVQVILEIVNSTDSKTSNNSSLVQQTPINVVNNRTEKNYTGERTGRTFFTPSKINGIDKHGRRNPEELIRKALINHTLEHGGEEDLDKLVFSTLPQGSKLILRTVKIIRTDDSGEPIDDVEDTQPTYWDVTLANATDTVPDEEEEVSGESEEYSSEENEENEEEQPSKEASKEKESPEVVDTKSVPLAQAIHTTPIIVENNRSAAEKKKSDLESSGSHSSANYHHLNNYGSTDREKEHGKSQFHGNTHGKTHKQTYTVSDGKKVKPYEGTEKGVTDYANSKANGDAKEGERFKSSKRKNKGRKVSGFKRIYHKEEFQRTEHFFDDEEANKIAESFGLSYAKDNSNHGTKGDKRKYDGVRTEYLDGKKVKNQHGTRDGYDKGQHNTYKDTEKLTHHRDYGKSMSHGSPPHHQSTYYHQPEHTDHHPNHNYHGSYSSPMKNTIAKVPASVADQIDNGGRNEALQASIVAAPMATSFTVTEYSNSPLTTDSSVTSDPSIMAELTKTLRKYPISRLPPESSSSTIEEYENPPSTRLDNDDRRKGGRRPSSRKEPPREKKLFYAPKYRPIKEDDTPAMVQVKHSPKNFKSVPSNPVPYQVPISSTTSKGRDARLEVVRDDDIDERTPYAPNFGPRKKPSRPSRPQRPPPREQDYRQEDYRQDEQRKPPPKSWRYPRKHKVHSSSYAPSHSMDHLETGAYPVNSHMQLAPEPLSISLRHSSAYQKLGNRDRNHYHHPDIVDYHERSTRKSDVDNARYQSRNGTTFSGNENDNDNAHYFNHDHRYAKNHMTSTTTPSDAQRVRNTIIEPVPEVYSTVIKVLPATMINVNDTSVQSNRGYEPFHNNALTASGNIVSVTRRPTSHADGISITTAYPPPPPQRPPHQRPFLPNSRWLSLSVNLGNPDFKLGNEFGPSQHPFKHNTKKVSRIMQGIKNGLFKPFGRGLFMPHHALLTSPSATRPAYQLHSRVPFAAAHFHHQHNPRHRQLRNYPLGPPPPPPQFRQDMPLQHAPNAFVYERPAGIMPQGSLAQVRSIAPPPPMSTPPPPAKSNRRPKFYYNYKTAPPITLISTTSIQPETNGTSTTTEDDILPVTSTEEEEEEEELPQTEVTTTIIKRTTRSTSTLASITSTPLQQDDLTPRRHHSPPFINGLMDSVANFFGKIG